jgi:DNA-binding transcriptional LysR family regulator
MIRRKIMNNGAPRDPLIFTVPAYGFVMALYLDWLDPGSNEWLIDVCREAGFMPRILQDADREPAVLSFVAAGLGVALLPEQIKRLPHEGVIFRPLRQRLTADSWAVWKGTNGSACLKQYLQIVKELA